VTKTKNKMMLKMSRAILKMALKMRMTQVVMMETARQMQKKLSRRQIMLTVKAIQPRIITTIRMMAVMKLQLMMVVQRTMIKQ
jgi:hypothetical protein